MGGGGGGVGDLRDESASNPIPASDVDVSKLKGLRIANLIKRKYFIEACR